MRLPHRNRQRMKLIEQAYPLAIRTTGKGLPSKLSQHVIGDGRAPWSRLYQPMTFSDPPKILIRNRDWTPKRIKQNRIRRFRPHTR